MFRQPFGDSRHPLPGALQAFNTEQAKQFSESLVSCLPAAISSLSADAHNQSEAAAVYALRQQLEAQLEPLQQRLADELRNRLDPLRKPSRPRLLDFERLAYTPHEEAEDNAAIASLGSSFSQLAGGEALGNRLAAMAQQLAVPGMAGALNPAAPCAAFLASLRALGVQAEARMQALRPLETHGTRLWQAWLKAAEVLLDTPALAVVRGPLAEEPDAVMGLSAAAERQLRALAEAKDALPDARLAAELLRIVEQGEAASDAVIALNRWLDILLNEAQLPAALQEEWEALRLSLCRVALHDTSFFMQATHPLRERMGALSVQSALTLPGLATLAVVRLALRAFAQELSGKVNTDEVLSMLSDWPSPPPQALRAFTASSQREASKRLDQLLNRVREAALDKLDWALLPAQQQAFVASGLAPLLCAAWLRDGAGSGADRAAQSLIEQWRRCCPANSSPTQRNALKLALHHAWAALGADPLRLESLSRALQRSWHQPVAAMAAEDDSFDPDLEIDQLLAALENGEDPSLPGDAARAAGAPTASQQQEVSLSQLFVHGRWLRVPQTSGDGARFLSISRYDPRQKMVLLETATGETAATRPVQALLDDLISGEAEFLSPDEVTTSTLMGLRQQRAGASASPA